jgi:hypothetical protein
MLYSMDISYSRLEITYFTFEAVFQDIYMYGVSPICVVDVHCYTEVREVVDERELFPNLDKWKIRVCRRWFLL